MKYKEDFFFLKVFKDDCLGDHIHLTDAVNLFSRVTPSFFIKQINRLISETENKKISFRLASSHPDIYELIKYMSDHVGLCVIYARSDIRPEAVPYTLSLMLYLDAGKVSIDCDWCAYKESRADEIVDTLIKPLLTFCVGKTYIEKSEGGGKLDFHNLIPMRSGVLNQRLSPVILYPNFDNIVEATMSLAGYPDIAEQTIKNAKARINYFPE